MQRTKVCPFAAMAVQRKKGITPFELLYFSGVGVGYHPLGTGSKTN
jgi:hypothetical protein